MPDQPEQVARPGPDFLTTHWSVVLRAGDLASPRREQALETLCRAYWYPLYAYVRRCGYAEEEAKDLTQGFFLRLLEKNYLGDVDTRRGRFRTFLLTSLGHFLANEWDKTRAQKRGGDVQFLSLDAVDAEGRYRLEPVDGSTPETIFERRWAEAVLEAVLARLRREFDEPGRGRRFDDLKPFLLGKDAGVAYAEVATRLGVSETGARSVVHRLRKRFRELVREEIAQTVSGPEEVDAEILHLFQVLSQ